MMQYVYVYNVTYCSGTVETLVFRGTEELWKMWSNILKCLLCKLEIKAQVEIK